MPSNATKIECFKQVNLHVHPQDKNNKIVMLILLQMD